METPSCCALSLNRVPVETYLRLKVSASLLACVVLPEPWGPAMVMTSLRLLILDIPLLGVDLECEAEEAADYDA